jgi:4-hydroxy-2-oxoheptanedioate aldolase
MDAAGIMVPHVMSLDDAKEIVRLTRFHPVGRRPLDGGNADGAYCGVPLNRYIVECNEQRLVAVQIEDPEVLDDMEAIARLPGIDMLFFGPGDFSQGLGVPGRVSDPRVIETRREVAATARRHGKFAGTVASCESIHERIAEGYQFISVGADVVALAQYYGDIIKAFSAAEANGSASPDGDGEVYSAGPAATGRR